jgi:hypothetical protein
MDKTLEIYINMCRESTEIQAEHKAFTDSIHADFKTLKDAQRTDNPIGGTATLAQLGKHNITVDGIWVPTQSELQSMSSSGSTAEDLRQFYLFATEPRYFTGPKANICYSMEMSREQLELAYVMDKLYGKRWGGDQWIRP